MWDKIFQASLNEELDEAIRINPSQGLPENFCEPLTPSIGRTLKSYPQILLVDDDPTFGKIMKRAALSQGIDLTYCESLVNFGELENWYFDAVIMDYDLGAVTGFELTNYLEQQTKNEVPVVLVSRTSQHNPEGWPSSIREFVNKKKGPFAILNATCAAYEGYLMRKNMEAKRRS